jgi:hypothetical protein
MFVCLRELLHSNKTTVGYIAFYFIRCCTNGALLGEKDKSDNKLYSLILSFWTQSVSVV